MKSSLRAFYLLMTSARQNPEANHEAWPWLQEAWCCWRRGLCLHFTQGSFPLVIPALCNRGLGVSPSDTPEQHPEKQWNRQRLQLCPLLGQTHQREAVGTCPAGLAQCSSRALMPPLLTLRAWSPQWQHAAWPEHGSFLMSAEPQGG